MTVRDLHNLAISALDRALQLERANQDATDAFRSAYEHESAALKLFLSSDKADSEPTRSVLCRSAASLAMDCGLTREAEKIAALGLSGDPPSPIDDQLRTVLDRAGFERHLALKGLRLVGPEAQVSLHGSDIAPGMAPLDEVESRMRATRMLAYRGAERRKGKQYRMGSMPDKGITNAIRPYASLPRAASYAFTIRFGTPIVANQLSLEGSGLSDLASDVVDDLLEGLRLLEQDRREELEKLIPDEAYRRNFVSLASEIFPDGKSVSQVGFTVVRYGFEKSVALTAPRRKPKGDGRRESTGSPRTRQDERAFRGILLDGLGSDGKIKIQQENGQVTTVKVLSGLEDVVRSHFLSPVEVVTMRKGRVVELQEIRRVVDDQEGVPETCPGD